MKRKLIPPVVAALVLAGLAVTAGSATMTSASAASTTLASDARSAPAFRVVSREAAGHGRVVKTWRSADGSTITYKGLRGGKLHLVHDSPGHAHIVIQAPHGRFSETNSYQSSNHVNGPGGSFCVTMDRSSNDVHARVCDNEKIADRRANGVPNYVLDEVDGSTWATGGCFIGPYRCKSPTHLWADLIYYGSNMDLVNWQPQASYNVGSCSSYGVSLSYAGVGISGSANVCPDTFGPRDLGPQSMGAVWRTNSGVGLNNYRGIAFGALEHLQKDVDYRGRYLVVDMGWFEPS